MGDAPRPPPGGTSATPSATSRPPRSSRRSRSRIRPRSVASSTRLLADLAGRRRRARGRSARAARAARSSPGGARRVRPTVAGLRDHGPRDRVPWVAGPMSAMSFATARLMETWAHGQDVVRRARGRARADRPPAPRGGARCAHAPVRLRGARARAARRRGAGGAHRAGRSRRGRGANRPPTSSAVLRSTSASSSRSAATRPTPRCRSSGPLASEWIPIAQAFAGPPTDTRPVRTRDRPGR